MAEQTPEQFARKLARLPQAVKASQSKGLTARARVTQRYIVAAAKTRMPNKAGERWVSVKVADDVATVRLRGGFAHLTELGSYKKPGGWEETPKTVSARRIKNAAKKGVTLHQNAALNTPYGPRASVHHPQLRARPFWKEGLAASRTPGKKAYQAAAVDEPIRSVLH